MTDQKTYSSYDYLIVGAGLFGSVFAYKARQAGKKCLVIDKREHIGGNIYTRDVEGVHVHQYGPHIFHTNDKVIWDFVNQFATFNKFINSPKANFKGESYSLPFNMNTFQELWNVSTEKEARSIIKSQCVTYDKIENLEQQVLSTLGTDIYTKLIKGYTEKQWGRKCSELPPSVIKRLPIRYIYDNNYYSDTYQGIPLGGYTQIVEKLLEGVEVRLGLDFFDNRELQNDVKHTVYTGKIDQYYDYRYGQLSYRTMTFEHERLSQENFQGNALVNYTDAETPYTRIIEHKHFEETVCEHTVITREYPKESKVDDEPHYPIGDICNREIYEKYKKLNNSEVAVTFGGRLAEYKYYDMHQVIASALSKADHILHEKNY